MIRGGPRTAATSKMERLVIIVNGFQLLLFEVNFEKWKRKFYEGRLLKDSTKVFFSTLKISFSDFSKFCWQPFHDGGRYQIEICPLIGFYMISASVLKGLNRNISIKNEVKFTYKVCTGVKVSCVVHSNTQCLETMQRSNESSNRHLP